MAIVSSSTQNFIESASDIAQDISQTNKLIEDLINELNINFTKINEDAFQQLANLHEQSSSFSSSTSTSPDLAPLSTSNSKPLLSNENGNINEKKKTVADSDILTSNSFSISSVEDTEPLGITEPVEMLEVEVDYLDASKYSFVTNQWKHHSPLGKKLSSPTGDPVDIAFFDPIFPLDEISRSSSRAQSSSSQEPLKKSAFSEIRFQTIPKSPQSTIERENFESSTTQPLFSAALNHSKENSTLPSTEKHSLATSSTLASPRKSTSSNDHPFHISTTPTSREMPSTSLSSLPIQSSEMVSDARQKPSTSSVQANHEALQLLQAKLDQTTQELQSKNTALLHLRDFLDGLKTRCDSHQQHLEEKESLIRDLHQRIQSLEDVLHEQQSVRQLTKTTQEQAVQATSWDARKREKLKRKLHALMEKRLQQLMQAKLENSSHRMFGKPKVIPKTQRTPSTSMPFVVGTNTGKSYSLPVNLQKMMALVQKHRQCEICEDEPNPKAMVAAHLESEQKRLEKEYAKIRKEYSEALQVYDGASLENKVVMHSILKELASIMASKAEALAALTQTKASHSVKATPQRKVGKKARSMDATPKSLGLLRSSQRVQSVLQGQGK